MLLDSSHNENWQSRVHSRTIDSLHICMKENWKLDCSYLGYKHFQNGSCNQLNLIPIIATSNME